MANAGRGGGAISSAAYYGEYHGHRVEHLAKVHEGLRKGGCEAFVWLAGDSSLDNKHWLFPGEKNEAAMLRDDVAAPALNGYEHLLRPPRMGRDVCYWLNHGLHSAAKAKTISRQICAINTSVEESTLGQRVEGKRQLLPQDEFIREHIGPEDVLIIDVGGNDVALAPTFWTAINMAALIYLSVTCIIQKLSCAWAPCNGFYFGFPLGLGYFVNMFKNKTVAYVSRLVEKQKPKKVIVCMLYYLDEHPSGSWADGVLGMLGYDKNPAKLKSVIKRVFELGTSRISIPGVEVVPFPLFTVLDGTNPGDYVARVEPSAEGGRKMAEALLPFVLGEGPSAAPE